MDTARITVRVTPRSASESVTPGAGGVLLVRVTAPPDGGKANAAVCRAVARALGVPPSRVTVSRGGSARTKQLLVEGIGADEAVALLGLTRHE